MICRYEGQAPELRARLSESKMHDKGIHQRIEWVLDFRKNIEKAYPEASLDIKQELIGSIFTNKLFFEENQVRTTKLNNVIGWFSIAARILREPKKDN